MNKEKNKLKNIFDIRKIPMDFGRFVFFLFLPLLFRIKKINCNGGKYKGFLKGRAILAANHTTMSDPLVLSTAFFYRRVYFLAAETVMNQKIKGLLLKGLGCIRIDRNISDIDAIRRAVSKLKAEKLLTVFPQGKIISEDELNQIKSGVALIALQGDAPVIPIYIANRKHWYNRTVVIIGEPIFCREYCIKKVPTVKDIEKISSVILEKMEECERVYNKLKGG